MKWHVHKWKFSGTLSWLIKISTIIPGLKTLSLITTHNFKGWPDNTFTLVLLSLIFLLYILQTYLSFRSRELLSFITNLIILFTVGSFIGHMFISFDPFLTGMYALIMITAEMVHGLFYYLNAAERPLTIRQSLSLWMIAVALFLFGLVVLSVG